MQANHRQVTEFEGKKSCTDEDGSPGWAAPAPEGPAGGAIGVTALTVLVYAVYRPSPFWARSLTQRLMHALRVSFLLAPVRTPLKKQSWVCT